MGRQPASRVVRTHIYQLSSPSYMDTVSGTQKQFLRPQNRYMWVINTIINRIRLIKVLFIQVFRILQDKNSIIHVYLDFFLFHYRLLQDVEYSYNRTLLFIHSVYNRLHLLVPNSQSNPPQHHPPGNPKSIHGFLRGRLLKAVSSNCLSICFYHLAYAMVSINEEIVLNKVKVSIAPNQYVKFQFSRIQIEMDFS